jgi:hypothetical protein
MTMITLLTVLALGVPIAIIALILRELRRALASPDWTADERRMTLNVFASVLVGWFLVAAASSWLGAYRAAPNSVPTIQYPLLAPILVGAWLIWRSETLRRVIAAVPQHWLVSMQAFRVLGGVFLVLYAIGEMPGVFAWPAGIGDILVGVLAPVVGLAYARAPRQNADLVKWWNVLGLVDLAVAVVTGVASAPSLIQVAAFNRPNELIAMFPVVMVPAFLVPLWILMHIASLAKLRREAATGNTPHGVAMSRM